MIAIHAIVIAGLFYLIGPMALGGWFARLRDGEAVMPLPDRPGRPWPRWVQIAVVVGGVLAGIPLGYYTWVPLPIGGSADLIAPGLALFAGGMGLTLWARHTLGAYWGISSSFQVKLREDHKLIQTGPYARIRHPMYAGWWLALVGLVLIYWTWLPLVVLLMSVPSFHARARREDRALEGRFGDAWRAYAARSGFLLPRLGRQQ